MKLHEMKYTGEARQENYRVGRGHDFGSGKIAGKGHERQKVRSGGGARLGFGGGQAPLTRRLPKRGFMNFNRKEYVIISVAFLNGLEDGMGVTPELLIECGLVEKELDGIRILGEGGLEKRLSIKASEFFKSVIATIEQVNGKAEVI